MSATVVEDLVTLRNEVDDIARDAQQISSDSFEHPAPISYSFGIVSSAEKKIVSIFDSIRETLALLAPIAHFETTIGGFTAKTAISYSGFAASVWSSGTTEALVDAHLMSIDRAYAFRQAVTLVVAAIGNAVVAISIAVANPLTVWHAVRSAEALKSAVDRLAMAIRVNVQSASLTA